MDELVKVIVKETGLPEAQARQAATAAVKFLKEKLPAPLDAQLDTYLEGPAAAKGAEDLLNLGKSLFDMKD